MRLYERFRARANILKKKDFLADPDAHPNVIILEVKPGYMPRLKDYWIRNVIDLKSREQRVMFECVEDEWSLQAQNFMFHIRDQIAKKVDDETRQYKDHLYDMAKRHLNYVWPDGEVKSLYDLSREEVWRLTNTLMDMATEAEVAVSQFFAEHNQLEEALQRTTAELGG